jgi:hypothetical protein
MNREDSKPTKAVVGVFGFMDDLTKAISSVKEAKFDFTVYSPFASHEIEHVAAPGESPVKFFTAVGAVTGLTFGFALAILTSMDYPLRVSAKDIISIPGFVVIGYECTILFGALCTLLGMFAMCKLPNVLRSAGYDPRFSDDKFGLVVGCAPEQVRDVESSLKRFGAEDVEVRDAL